jgi:hypothetical protein
MSNDETGASALLAGIQKLKGVVNYQDWKFQLQNYLEQRNLWSEVKPTTSFMTLIHQIYNTGLVAVLPFAICHSHETVKYGHEYSLWPYSRLSRPQPLLFPSSSSVVLTRLSGPHSRPTTFFL